MDHVHRPMQSTHLALHITQPTVAKYKIYWCLKSAEYLRRRADVETFGLRTVGLDGHHGELEDLARRGEGQKRGDQHDHYCLWARSCGYLFASSLHTTGVKP